MWEKEAVQLRETSVGIPAPREPGIPYRASRIPRIVTVYGSGAGTYDLIIQRKTKEQKKTVKEMRAEPTIHVALLFPRCYLNTCVYGDRGGGGGGRCYVEVGIRSGNCQFEHN